MDLSRYCSDWTLHADGIWRAPATGDLSYPPGGNDECFQVEEESFWFRHRNRVIAALISRFPPPDAFFDVGGGNGFVSLHLQRLGIPTVLVEPGASGVENARQRGVANVVQGLWMPERIREGAAGAVGLFDVLEHIHDDVGFLRGVRQTVAPGGLLFLTVPALPLLWSSDDVAAGHFRRYRLAGLRRLVEAAGFRCEFSGHLFSPLPPAIFLMRTLPDAFGLQRRAGIERTRQEHSTGPGWLGQLLNRALEWEAQRYSRGRSVPFGSSIVLVARRPAG